MTDEEAIRQLFARFIHLRDDKRFDEWVELFTGNGRFEYGDNVMNGRVAIRDHVSALLHGDRGKHLCVNSIIEVDGDRATASSDFVKMNPSAGPGRAPFEIGTMGRYEDDLVRQNGEWKIAWRRVVIAPSGDVGR